MTGSTGPPVGFGGGASSQCAEPPDLVLDSPAGSPNSGAGARGAGGELLGMGHRGLDNLMSRIGERVLAEDDILRSAWAVRRNEDAVRDLFDRLAGVCLDQLFLDLEFRHLVEELTDDEYLLETAKLIAQCRTVGLDPPVRIDQLDLDLDASEDRSHTRGYESPLE